VTGKGLSFNFLLLLILWGLGVSPLPDPLYASEKRGEIKSYIRQATPLIFNLDEKGGFEWLRKASDLDREDPVPHAFLSAAHLFFYETSFEEKEKRRHQERMLSSAGEALTKGEKTLEKNPRDGEAGLAVAMAKLTKARWYIIQKRYFAMAQETQGIWDYLEKARELQPENYDTYFPMGLLHYHIGHLPGFTRFLSSLFITSGDLQKGLQELEWAAQKGDLLKELAQSELVTAYSYFERAPEKALPLAQELKQRFPRNYNFSFALANVLTELGRNDQAFALAREIDQGIRSGTPPFRPELRPRYHLLLGRIHFNRGEYEPAAENFKMILQDKTPYNIRVRIWAWVRLGMIHDVRKERQQAIEHYEKALEMEGGEGLAQVTAKQYLKSPYGLPPAEGK
jgi:hypothetical protein